MPDPSPLRPRAEELYDRMVDRIDRVGRGSGRFSLDDAVSLILAEIATIKAALEAAGLIEIREVPRG